MPRLPDWPQRLDAFIESRRGTPFAYGSHDCCLFSAGAVEAITGENVAARWHYTNEIGARRLMAKWGGVDGLVTAALGDPCHPSQAGRGDIVMAELTNGETIGVCLGAVCAFAEEPQGVALRPRSLILKAWKV